MEQRFCCSPSEAGNFNSSELRSHFLIENLMIPGHLCGVYTHYDRMVVLGASPLKDALALPAFGDFTKQEFFLQRREMGIINIGGAGIVKVDGADYTMQPLDCLYIGMGNRDIGFLSLDAGNPACFYMTSAPAHQSFPVVHVSRTSANAIELGDPANCNARRIYQYIHQDGIKSCQLVMGFTSLKPGNVWNTFPPHVHHRRMEVYFYFNLPANGRVCHLMGEPTETRHLFVKNMEAVISPDWSIHAGAGTCHYNFIWAMAGENMEFADMDPVGPELIK